MRIGHGYDAHAFCDNKQLVLGGVAIDYAKGLLAHSDGDVALHAVCDALLGAIGEGDIGRHFPDSSDEFKNIDSRILLRDVFAKVSSHSFEIANVDITIIAQAPKLASYIGAMVANISSDLSCSTNQVNVKATTTEGMGFAGRKEGIEVHAVVLLVGKVIDV